MKIIGSRFRSRGKRQRPAPVSSTPGKEDEDGKQEPEAMPSHPASPKFKKKALLIGVRKIREAEDVATPILPTNAKLESGKGNSRRKRSDSGVLNGPHPDALAMQNLLIDVYKYDKDDITVLIDDDDPQHVQPTRANIIAAMLDLVEDAREHDRFFFHFSGHSTQEDTDDIEEEDGKNECIMTSDGQTIKDDELRDYLVKPLPPKASLIAVFDSCHSGSLLDLKHFRCNSVYVPWLNKGQRRTHSLWNMNKRRQARVSTRAVQEYRRVSSNVVHWTKTSIDQLMLPAEEAAELGVVSTPVVTKKKTSLSVVTENLPSPSWLDSPVRRCSSPEMLYCSGDCRTNPLWQQDNIPQADVISLSSSQDEQKTWEGADGASMTQALVNILRHDPHPTLRALLTLVNHDLYDFYINLHAKAYEYRKKLRETNKKREKEGKKPKRGMSVEMNNFPNPQLSSDRPLDLSRQWYP